MNGTLRNNINMTYKIEEADVFFSTRSGSPLHGCR